MELEEAIESLENLKILFEIEDERDFEATPKQQRIIAQQIEVVLNHLAKQEKMIDLMAERIEYDTEWFYSDLDNKKADEIKQYFEKKAEEVD